MKKFNELTTTAKVDLVLTAAYGLAGIGLIIYGSIKEKQALREFRDAVVQNEFEKLKTENNRSNQED